MCIYVPCFTQNAGCMVISYGGLLSASRDSTCIYCIETAYSRTPVGWWWFWSEGPVAPAVRCHSCRWWWSPWQAQWYETEQVSGKTCQLQCGPLSQPTVGTWHVCMIYTVDISLCTVYVHTCMYTCMRTSRYLFTLVQDMHVGCAVLNSLTCTYIHRLREVLTTTGHRSTAAEVPAY